MILALLLACARPGGRSTDEAAAVAARAPEVRYRPGAPADEAGRWLVDATGGTWDRGLVSACEALLGATVDRGAALSARATVAAAARAGYPGPARFARALNGGAPPEALIEQILASQAGDGRALDVGLARRSWGDGLALWIVGWAPRVVELDPLPRDLPLDASLGVRVDAPKGSDLALYVAPPDGPVAELSLSSGVARWLDDFHSPGEHRLAVALRSGDEPEIALRFSVFVDQPPEPLPPLRAVTPPPDPVAAEAALYDALDALRRAHGLRPVRRFPLFEPLAREHSALMAASGAVSHRIPGQGGVADRAAALAHPRAILHENVAAAATAEDAAALVETSPPHLANLLCEPCTAASIGVALEPVLDRPPRLFVTWELLELPNGEPRPIDHYNR